MVEKKKGSIQLPKDALSRIHLGHSFAEYDIIRSNPQIIVKTPALLAAEASGRAKCFFVGRRGTGKTAITYHFATTQKNSARILRLKVPDRGCTV